MGQRSRDPPFRIDHGGNAGAALWGKIRTTADYAALLNATSAHSLDYDDTSGESHPSAVLFPALLAVGEPFATGKDVLSAYIAGYEIWTRSEEHTSELQSLMRISYAVFCLKKKTKLTTYHT